MAQINYTYTTYPLPSPISQAIPPKNLALIAKKYSNLRLSALLTSPTAYASTHAIESVFSQEQWEKRVWRDGVTVFVCIAEPTAESLAQLPTGRESDSPDLGELDGEWVGAGTVFGPVPKVAYELAPESRSPETGADGEETKWQMTALYTSPEHRGKGLAKNLIEGVKTYARTHTLSILPLSKRIRLRIMIRPDNVVVCSLYSTLGFLDAGRATGREAFVANGDEGLVILKMAGPEDGRQMMLARNALVMEYSEVLAD